MLALYPGPFEVLPAGEVLTSRLAADPDAALTWANEPNAHREATAILAAAGVPVPELLGMDGPLGVVGAWDVGDVPLQRRVEGAEAPVWQRWYAEAAALTARVASASAETARVEAVSARLALDGPKLAWEMAYFDRAMWEGYRIEGGLSAGDRAAALTALTALCRYLGERPRTLCHRDFHARNLMVWAGPVGRDDAPPPGERLVVIDHQDLRMGPASYDMVSLLEDPYVQPPRGLHVDLWRGWAAVTGADLPSLEEEILAMTVQRLVKAAGTYAHQVAIKGDRRFEPLLRPTLTRALDALDELGTFSGARFALEAACGP